VGDFSQPVIEEVQGGGRAAGGGAAGAPSRPWVAGGQGQRRRLLHGGKEAVDADREAEVIDVGDGRAEKAKRVAATGHQKEEGVTLSPYRTRVALRISCVILSTDVSSIYNTELTERKVKCTYK
jgi:hypothetical protein